MQIPLLHQQIILQTERLRDLHRSIMLHSSPVPAAEMEGLLLEIRKLYGIALELNHENALELLNEVQLAIAHSIPATSKSSLQATADTTRSESIHHETNIPEVPDNAVAEQAKEEHYHSSPLTGESGTEKKRIVSGIHERFKDSPSLADTFADHQTLGEKIAGNDSKKRVSDNLKSSVKDIKAAIGLNEKFQFINQLFKGDPIKYNAFIDQLNTSHSSEVAMNLIRDISEANNWESHAGSARLFIDIIERRFSA